MRNFNNKTHSLIHNVLCLFLLTQVILNLGCARVLKNKVDTPLASPILESDLSAHFIANAPIPEPVEISPFNNTVDIFPLFSVSVSSVPVVEFVQALAHDAGLQLTVVGSPVGMLSIELLDSSLVEILDHVVRQYAVRYELDENKLIFYEDKPYLKTYSVDYLNISRKSSSEVELATQIDSISLTVDGSNANQTHANNSKASILNNSENNFWITLWNNLNAIVGTGKEDIGSVILNKEAGIVVVKARHSTQEQVSAFISQVVESAQRQVLIEALVVEVSLKDDFQAGIDWRVVASGTSGNNYVQNFSGNSPISQGNIRDTISPAAILSVFRNSLTGSDITATLSLLKEFGEVKILSSPKINALNNQAAVLKVVDNRVYFTIGVERVKTDETHEKITTTSEVRTVPIGLVMNVIPYISSENEIILNVRPTISRILGFVTDPSPDLAAAGVKNLVPEIQVREMESVLRVKSGGMVVIGGLMQDRISKKTVGVPFLSEIPLLGKLFSYQQEQTEKTELLVFLRPVVISGEADYRDRVVDFLRTSGSDK